MSEKSEINKLPTIERVFDLLDRWRHLPAYQLERRADVFFALFLPEVLGAHLSKQENCSVEINPTLIPEFPIKKIGNNQSEKADYLALSKDGERAFLIELKTDMASRRKEQDDYLKCAAKRGLPCLVCDILKICRATDEKAKYVHLLENLSQLGLVEHKDGGGNVRKELDQLYMNAIPVDRSRENWRSERIRQGREFAKELGNVVPAKTSPEVRVIYIQPTQPPDTIDFEKFATTIESGGSEKIRGLFACSLRQWVEKEAGLLDPTCLYR